ncbi:MAG TPA: hypothetical protein VEO54_09260 [Thermoanaerobaculia bacterium]|nr:hypothetical protein [Thermoanaerobaculia bacterium]
MFDENDLEPLLDRMQKIIRKADPELARVTVAERSEDPDGPCVLDDLDRVMAALTTVTAGRNVVGRRLWKSLLRSACRIRVRR